MKVRFKYRISGMVDNFEGEVDGEGNDYDATMKAAYDSLCDQHHNPFLTVTFKRLDQ